MARNKVRARAGPEPPKVSVDYKAAADRLRWIVGLTPPEHQVALLMLAGRTDQQIAVETDFDRSVRTIKRHVINVLDKTGAQNRNSLWAVLSADAGRDW
jgi:DNA-binding NarL/FixJ family response regulator